MRNLTMLTDLYQLTMMYGYFKSGMRDNMATFDMFYRSKDESTHYAVFAGLEQLIDYLQNLRFEDEATSNGTSRFPYIRNPASNPPISRLRE